MVDLDVVARKIATATARLRDVEALLDRSLEQFLSDLRMLADHEIIDRELAAVMRGAVGLRNRIAHGYATVDHARLYEEVREAYPLLRRFLTALADAAGL